MLTAQKTHVRLSANLCPFFSSLCIFKHAPRCKHPLCLQDDNHSLVCSRSLSVLPIIGFLSRQPRCEQLHVWCADPPHARKHYSWKLINTCECRLVLMDGHEQLFCRIRCNQCTQLFETDENVDFEFHCNHYEHHINIY